MLWQAQCLDQLWHSQDHTMASDKNRERFWRELIERQPTSGQRVGEFCTKAGVFTASIRGSEG